MDRKGPFIISVSLNGIKPGLVGVVVQVMAVGNPTPPAWQTRIAFRTVPPSVNSLGMSNWQFTEEKLPGHADDEEGKINMTSDLWGVYFQQNLPRDNPLVCDLGLPPQPSHVNMDMTQRTLQTQPWVVEFL